MIRTISKEIPSYSSAISHFLDWALLRSFLVPMTSKGMDLSGDDPEPIRREKSWEPPAVAAGVPNEVPAAARCDVKLELRKEWLLLLLLL